MTPLVDLAARSSVILAVGLLLDAALRRRAAALRHCVLAGAIAAAAVVVPLSLAVPSWEISLPSSRQAPPIQPEAHVTAAVTRTAVPAAPAAPRGGAPLARWPASGWPASSRLPRCSSPASPGWRGSRRAPSRCGTAGGPG
jgi:hypothetical protein